MSLSTLALQQRLRRRQIALSFVSEVDSDMRCEVASNE